VPGLFFLGTNVNVFLHDILLDGMAVAMYLLLILWIHRDQENIQLRATLERRTGEMAKEFERCAADMAHEFQTPIAILRGNLSLLVTSPSRTEQRRILDVAVQTLDRLSRLVTDLLEVAKLKASGNIFMKQTVNMKTLLKTICENYAVLAQDKKITISCTADPVAVAGNPDKLREVFLNLLSNAMKYTPAGGKISLSATVESGAAVMMVADTGAGIAPENLPRIFERFYKINTDAQSVGTGLGLHICRQIIEMHDGTIHAESVLGEGSRFTIRLPLADAPPPEESDSQVL
jgi:signal transduction histidine kinase